MALSLAQNPLTVLTYAGQYWPLQRMSDEQIKWLQGKFDTNNLRDLKNLAAVQAELDRRVPSPEKLRVIESIKANAFAISERFEEILAADRLLVSDLVTVTLKGQPTANRIEQAFELAIAGRWELPEGPGWPFKVDSFPGEVGGLKYQVKCKATRHHNYNHCSCEDFTYKAAGKLRGFCKHVITVWLVSEGHNSIGQ